MGAKSTFSPSSRHLSDDFFIDISDIALSVINQLKINTDTRGKIMKEINLLKNNLPNDAPNKGFSGPFWIPNVHLKKLPIIINYWYPICKINKNHDKYKTYYSRFF